MNISNELKAVLQSNGASIVGYADLRNIAPDIRDNLNFGVSIGVALHPEALPSIKTGPTQEYYEDFKRVNQLLSTLGHQAVLFLEERGYIARQLITTGDGYNKETLSAVLPHKTVATRAGTGWIGKCALLVTEEFGPAVRITAVLTNAKLATGTPTDASQCGDCTACVEACPGRAPSGKNWQVGLHRDDFFDVFKCRDAALSQANTRIGIQETICGICIAACPWTQQYINKSH
jgi:epoxyqueuosine reductase QueG